jgi:hypothetical protein
MARYPILLIAAATSLATLTAADAQQQQPQGPPRPCLAIRQVCLQAGFVLNGARAGEGLVVDCIRPIMQGTPQPRRATKPLPAVDPALVEACRAVNPSFGMGNGQPPRGAPRNGPPLATPGAAPPGAPPPGAPPPDEPGQPPQEEPPPPK